MLLLVMGLVAPSVSTDTLAQQANYPPMAAFGADGNLWLYGFDDEAIQITHTAKGIRDILLGDVQDLVWSPDGNVLAFVVSDGILRLRGLHNSKRIDVAPAKSVKWF